MQGFLLETLVLGTIKQGYFIILKKKFCSRTSGGTIITGKL